MARLEVLKTASMVPKGSRHFNLHLQCSSAAWLRHKHFNMVAHRLRITWLIPKGERFYQVSSWLSTNNGQKALGLRSKVLCRWGWGWLAVDWKAALVAPDFSVQFGGDQWKSVPLFLSTTRAISARPPWPLELKINLASPLRSICASGNNCKGSIISDQEYLNYLADLSPHHRHHMMADPTDLCSREAGQQCKLTRISH